MTNPDTTTFTWTYAVTAAAVAFALPALVVAVTLIDRAFTYWRDRHVRRALADVADLPTYREPKQVRVGGQR